MIFYSFHKCSEPLKLQPNLWKSIKTKVLTDIEQLQEFTSASFQISIWGNEENGGSVLINRLFAQLLII